MENENHVPTNTMPPQPPVENKVPANTVMPVTENTSSIGGIIGIIIVIAVIILGGLYFWGKRVEETQIETNPSTMTQETTDQQASVINSTSSSDTLDSISADLSATQTTDLSPELQ